MTKTDWKEIGSDQAGSHGQPGSQYNVREITISERAGRYKLAIHAAWGSNQGYYEDHGSDDRQYRADSLDELMRIAISAEQGREEPDQGVMTAIRNAIYEAEDAGATEVEVQP